MNTNPLSKLARDVRTSLSRHSPEILMGIGIAGMITTTILAVEATPKALELIEIEKEDLGVDTLTPVETVKATWKCYIPAVVSGAVATACLIGSHSVNASRNAALATAYKLSETAFSDYRDKVVETIGEKKERTVRDKVAEEQIKKHPVDRSEVIVTGKGQTLFFDPWTHRYFYSSIDKINRAVNKLNHKINTSAFVNDGVTLNDFYDEVGLPGSMTGEGLGWNLNTGLIEFYPSAQMVEEGEEHEGEPCIVLDFSSNPPRYDGFL